jgi:hypothetical protein
MNDLANLYYSPFNFRKFNLPNLIPWLSYPEQKKR